MKKIHTLLLSLFVCSTLFSQEAPKRCTFLLTGASFATPQNGWFEAACGLLGVTPLNRAVGGESIAVAANRVIDGTLYSADELENIDALVIMQVHDKDVFDETQLKEKYTDYKTPFDYGDYSPAYDYLIKRYLTDCYNLRFDEKSKYYNTTAGKPAIILLCTHWHDGRATYNASVRKLAEKWGFPLVEFDKYIGFSKQAVHPVTGKQISLLYSSDTQTADEVTVGWHPDNGQETYIQKRMAAIFDDTVRKIFLIK